jgi:Cys-tRNA(Pro)/Cys-tRNA(Cys) deacylase
VTPFSRRGPCIEQEGDIAPRQATGIRRGVDRSNLDRHGLVPALRMRIMGFVPPANNVTRLLHAKRIPYSAFELPPGKHSAIEVAAMLGADPSVVFKTIVVRRQAPKRNLLVLVGAARSVDLRRVAAFLGDKKVFLPTEREAETMTGLNAGGISPLALLNRGFDVLIDDTARDLDQIHISGGRRELNIRIAVSDLARVTAARLAPVGREPP